MIKKTFQCKAHKFVQGNDIYSIKRQYSTEIRSKVIW